MRAKQKKIWHSRVSVHKKNLMTQRGLLCLPCCALIFLRAPAVLTLLRLPVVPLFFFALTLLCPYFTFTYPAVPLFFYALTLFYFRLPCYALIFLRTHSCNLQDFFGSVCIAESTDIDSLPAAPPWCRLAPKFRETPLLLVPCPLFLGAILLL